MSTRHVLRVEIITRRNGRWTTQKWLQFIDAADFDPEDQTLGNLAVVAWDDLYRNSDIPGALEFAQSEDDRFMAFFDGKPIADEFASHVDADYFSEWWANRHPEAVA